MNLCAFTESDRRAVPRCSATPSWPECCWSGFVLRCTGCRKRRGQGAGGVMLHAVVAFVLLYCLLRSPGTMLLLVVLGAALVAG